MTRAGDLNRVRLLLACAVLALAAALSVGAGAAQAATCDTTWQGSAFQDWSNAGNWTNGVPDNTKSACINGSGPVEITGESAQAQSLTLSGAELDIQSNSTAPGTLTLSADSSIGAGGSIVLRSTCTSACGNGASLTISSGTLTNNATIAAQAGNDQSTRALNGNITNANGATIDVQAPLEYGAGAAGTLDNQGMIDLLHQQPLTVPYGVPKTVVNDTGGTIDNGGGPGVLTVGAGNTFNQAGGTTTPSTANPGDPAVVIDGSNLGSTLKYTGTGVSTVQVRNLVTLNGSLASGQNVVVDGVSSTGCPESLLTSGASFTNAGTITLTGPCESGIKTTSGMLTNTGALVAKAGANRELRGSLTNQGTLSINAPTAFDGPGATLTQTAGTTTISPSQFLDLTSSGGTFLLEGGLLQSPRSNTSHPGSITGSLNNSGGNLAPGSTTAPGDFSLSGHYTQGARGRLTAVIAGTQVGKTYSQLGVQGGSTLGGTLAIVTHSSFHPLASQFFTILGGSTDSGKFAKLIGQFPPGGVGYKPLYDKTDMTLEGTPAARLTVKLAGTAKGTVTSSPAGINCGTTCAASFFKPQTVTLTEHPVTGHKFKGWSGACTGKTTTCKVKMTKAKTVTATFS